ncbi:MAG: SURF1 family protein [Pseudomonadota bacterium]
MSLRFAPRWYWILIVAAASVLFVRLGFWQWHRGEYRRSEWQEFARGDAPAIDATASSLAHLPQYTRVRIGGVFDAAHQFLLENISHNGAPGYQVLTVLTLGDGSHLLADRGWVPFSGYRDKLPDVAFDAATAPPILTGRLGPAPVAGLAAGRQPPTLDGTWPRLASFPTIEQMAASYGTPLAPMLLLMDANSGPGYVRDWQPPGIPPERNFSYAIQWWSFAVLAIVLLVSLNLKRKNV